jgi:hypothetical protein
MLEITGPTSTGCHGITRRDLLRVGSLGLGGLTLPGLLRARAAAETASKPAAVIFVELDGGPSQFETYDPKPDAPLEYRGPLGHIDTNVAGVQFGELLPEQARVMDRLAIVRSVWHTNSEHGNSGHMMNTGYFFRGPEGSQEMPSVGSICARAAAPRNAHVPPYVSLLGPPRYGDALYLGAGCNPFTVTQPPHAVNFKVENIAPSNDLNIKRLEDRQTLMQGLDARRRLVDTAAEAGAIDTFMRKAFELVSTGHAAEAFDLAAEPDSERDRYGRTAEGQALLLARRLVEAGVMFIHVHSREWDDHGNLEDRMRVLRPRWDRAMGALVTDLYDRGLQDHVLMVAMGEFGRTPRMNVNAGRDHWGPLMSVAFSGGGLSVGQVIGSSTDKGETPRSDPYRPDSVLAMVYRHLGIDPARTFPDYSGRPQYILQERDLIHQLI